MTVGVLRKGRPVAAGEIQWPHGGVVGRASLAPPNTFLFLGASDYGGNDLVVRT